MGVRASISMQATMLDIHPAKAASQMPHICTSPANITANGLLRRPLAFNLDGWVSSGGDGKEYDGFLTRGSQTIEAWDSASSLNEITR